VSSVSTEYSTGRRLQIYHVLIDEGRIVYIHNSLRRSGPGFGQNPRFKTVNQDNQVEQGFETHDYQPNRSKDWIVSTESKSRKTHEGLKPQTPFK